MILKSRFFCSSIFLSSLSLFLNLAAHATEIRLHDCNGNLRASTELQDGQTKDIRFVLPSEEANAKARLSKIDSESSMEHRAKDMSLVFSSIESGDWKVCHEDGSGLVFNTVEFIDGDSEALRVASLIAGGTAVLSGIAIASGSSNTESDNAPASISEPNQPDRVESEKPVSALKPGVTSRPDGEVLVQSRCGKKPATLAAEFDEDCREDENAPIISPYD